MENNEFKYPKQVVSVKQEKNNVIKTLGVDSFLSLPHYNEGTEKVMPLEMHPKYSRFVATMIRKEPSGMIFPKANIPAEDVRFIYEKTLLAMNLIMTTGTSVSGEKQSLAYTEKFQMGNLKGKTPAEVLIADAKNKELLLTQKNFLSKNAEKFPANKRLMNAIDDAIALMDAGNLKSDVPAATKTFEIYNEQMKPLRSTKDNAGYCLTYGISIICDPSRNLPFCITINNCKAQVIESDNGKLNVKMKEAKDQQSNFMNLSEKDWFKVIDRMNTTLNRFEAVGYPEMLKLSNDISYKQYTESKKNTDTVA